jgi:hypothetical protein
MASRPAVSIELCFATQVAGRRALRQRQTAGQDMDHAAQPGAEAGAHAFRAAPRERARSDVKDARTGRNGKQESRGEVQGELGHVWHGGMTPTKGFINIDRRGLSGVGLAAGVEQGKPAAQRAAALWRTLLAWAAQTGACVIEDDYDTEYRHGIAPIPPLQTLDAESAIYVGTVSKTLSPTLRLGYLVVPTALGQAFREAKRLTDRHTPYLRCMTRPSSDRRWPGSFSAMPGLTPTH